MKCVKKITVTRKTANWHSRRETKVNNNNKNKSQIDRLI